MNRLGTDDAKHLILDGGLGTELEKRGCDVRDSLWPARVLLESPEIIERVHLDYLEAGADCIITASYQVSFEGFSRAGLSRQETIKALEESVALARRARDRFDAIAKGRQRPIVAASIGPYGASLGDGSEFHGAYNCGIQELRTFHGARLNILQASGSDMLACETIPSLGEAEVILREVQKFPGARGWFSFTCRDGIHTAHGERLQDCARMLAPESAVAAIGINCTAPAFVGSLIQEIRSVTLKPIVVYPNSGQKWDGKTRCWVGDKNALDLGMLASEWSRKGATWIGGCCGTSLDDIRNIRMSLCGEI